MVPAPFNQLPRSVGQNTGNCTSDDLFYDFILTWIMAYVYPGQVKMTIEENVVTHACYKHIQNMFRPHLREIMSVMSYSLYGTGKRILPGAKVSPSFKLIAKSMKVMHVFTF